MSLKNFFFLALIFFCISTVGFLYVQNPEIYKRNKEILVEVVEEKPAEFIITGDIMLGRFVEVLMEGNGEKYPFQKITEFLHSVPVVVGNLEGPIVENHVQTPSLTFAFSFASSTAQILKENNISVVSLANNHTLDQEDKGYADTKRYLKDAGVQYFGHPITVGDLSVLRKKIKDQNVVFVGFNATWPFEEKQYEDLIKKEALGDEFVVVVIHWGDEYKLVSNETQKNLARMFIDSGADLVVGHHPHVVQEIEVYKNKAIFYSLGNFIFDQYFSKNVKEGLLVKIVLTDQKVTYELFPIISPRSQPSLMEGEAQQDLLSSLAKRSSLEIQDKVKKGVIELEMF